MGHHASARKAFSLCLKIIIFGSTACGAVEYNVYGCPQKQ